jgi:hypothetical protein
VINKIFKGKITTTIFFICMAILVTLSTTLIGRLGDEYRCSYDDYKEQNRDARGIPFIMLQRSVQSTSCSPVYLDKTSVPDFGNRQINTTNIFLNIVFWYLVLLGLRQFFHAIESSKTTKS